MRERAANQGSRRERGQNEGGGNTAEGGRKCGGTCLWGLAPAIGGGQKSAENRPLHRQNWVRIRRVTPPRKSAIKAYFATQGLSVALGILLAFIVGLSGPSKHDTAEPKAPGLSQPFPPGDTDEVEHGRAEPKAPDLSQPFPGARRPRAGQMPRQNGKRVIMSRTGSGAR